MTQTGRYHGGLVFFGKQDCALDRFSRIVTATLEDYGHQVERQSIMDPQHSRIVSSQYMVKLTLEDVPEAEDDPDWSDPNGEWLNDAGQTNLMDGLWAETSAQRVQIDLCPVEPGREDRDLAELLMVVMLYRMVDVCAARQIEWLDPGVVLTVEQFLGAFADVSPRRVHSRQQIIDPDKPRFAPVDETEQSLSMAYDEISGRRPHDGEQGLISLTDEEALALAFRLDPRPDEVDGMSPEQEAENDIRRLATWGMTGMIFFLSAPVAVSVAAVNLARGEDFRLNTHVLSLTGLLVVLQSSGALAGAVSLLPV